jgi:hypothetical protein
MFPMRVRAGATGTGRRYGIMNGLTRVCSLAALVIAAGVSQSATAADDGMLFVKSTPAGATIWLDGVETEYRTPRLIGGVSVGMHNVVVRLPGHTPERQAVEVAAGKIRTLLFDLHRGGDGDDGATLTIKTEPSGAIVWVDTVERGKTPVELSGLKPGKHEVILMRNGYELVERTVELSAGAQRTIEIRLTSEDGHEPHRVDRPGDERPVGDTTGPVVEEPATTAPDEIPDKIDVKCPYCEGNGVIKRIGCNQCNRTGRTNVTKCRQCVGTRWIDFACRACAGKGTAGGGREGPCRLCKGKGYPACGACRGRGTIERANPEKSKVPMKMCGQCSGSGFEQQLKCGYCKGTGKNIVVYGNDWGVYQRKVECVFCGGDGHGPALCVRCRGDGSFGSRERLQVCKGCMGTGAHHTACRYCRGKGVVPDR